MRKLFRILIIIFFILNIQTINTYGETLNLIEKKLDDIGIDNKYSMNIIEYISKLSVDYDNKEKILEDINSIIKNISNKNSYNDFKFSELLNIYSEILDIANDLNIDIEIDYLNKEIELSEKDSNLRLIRCNINDIKRYYKNYKKDPFTYSEYNKIKNYIDQANITDNINLSSIEGKSKLNRTEYDNNKLNQELNENNEISHNNYIDIKSNNDNMILNKASVIKNENINRVFSIIFLVIFACVVVSILIGSIFFRKEINNLGFILKVLRK